MTRASLLRTIQVDVLDEPRRLYRVCSPREADGFIESFRSHYELGRPPRGPEDRAAVIHMAVSMFDSPEIAAQLASRVPKLGGHVAHVDLLPGNGFCAAKTGGPAHWSVWGRPLQLAGAVVDVVSVG